MPNVAHSTLTGANLHEPKGVATASANTVYVANGAGSGTWEQLPAAALNPAANSFGAGLIHVIEQQPSGTPGASPTVNNTWNVRVLNTVLTNDLAAQGASLISNRVALPIGTYFAIGFMVGFLEPGLSSVDGIAKMTSKLFNFTTSLDLIIGSAEQAQNAQAGTAFTNAFYPAKSTVSGRFTLAAPSSIELRMWPHNVAPGVANSTGSIEVYSDLMIWKVA